MKDRIIGTELTVSLADGTKKDGVILSIVDNKRSYQSADGQKLFDVVRVTGGLLSVSPGMYAAIVLSCPAEEGES
jgi:hypothetical protein